MTLGCRALALAVALAATPARAEPLRALLDAVAANARFPSPTAADVRLERRRGETASNGRAVIVGNGRTIYVETPDGTRALVRSNKILVRAGTRIVRSPVGARLAGTDVLLEDLAVFSPSLMKVPQVSDEGPTGVVVTGAPAGPSARALIVLTIDPATHAIARAKYFERSISDLAAYRRDETFQTIDAHVRPTLIVVERPNDGTSTRLELGWRAAPELPRALFTPAGLRDPSPLRW
jgi:hypothetical protein